MIKNSYKIAGITLLLLLVSCIKSDYDTENCPGLYTITPLVPVELQQSTNEFLSEAATSVKYPTDAQWRITEVGPDNTLELLKGQYRAYSVKGATDQVTIHSGSTVSVSSENGAAGEPGNFVAGAIDFNVEGGLVDWGIINYDLPTYIQTRLLTLKVKIEGDNSSLVESVSATVDGIALSRELRDAFIEDGERNRYPSLSTGYAAYAMDVKENDGFYTDSRRLLGLDGNAKQNLALTIHYEGGFKKSFLYDITGDLDGFHTRKVIEPWFIHIVLRAGADFTATIEDWQSGPEKWMDATPNN